MHRSVLIIDHDENSIRSLQPIFERMNWKVHATASPQHALGTFEQIEPPLVLLDLHLPIISGLEMLTILRERDPQAAIVMLSREATVETALAAMRLGAENYLTKPVSGEHLAVVAERAFDSVRLRRMNRVMMRYLEGEASPTGLAVRASRNMRNLDEQIASAADADSTILLIGETGTGKSAIARTIHKRSNRASAPFVEVNCAALPTESLEQRLFGEERITARGRRVEPRGLVEVAGGGSLFLDQVGTLKPPLQAKLLQLLQTGKFVRIGGTTEMDSDVRVIAATSGLRERVNGGTFREDLYDALAAVSLPLRPLREEATEELFITAHVLLTQLQSQLGGGPTPSISRGAADLLASYEWPGNVREMRNVLERMLILNPGISEIDVAHLPPEISNQEEDLPLGAPDPSLPLEEVEREHILAALRHFEGNRSAAAKSLRIARRSLYTKLAQYGLTDSSR